MRAKGFAFSIWLSVIFRFDIKAHRAKAIVARNHCTLRIFHPSVEEIPATERKFFDKRRNAVPCALAKTVGNLPVFAYENVPYLYVARMLDRVFVLLHQILVFCFPHRSDKHVFHKISPSKIYHLRTYMSMPIINEKTPPLHYVASITLQKKRKQQELYE